MPLFHFEAKDSTGKIQTGQLEAASEHAAVKQLHEKSYFVLRLTPVKTAADTSPKKFSLWRFVLEPVIRPVSSKARARFFSQFAATLASGMNVHEAALLLAERGPSGTLRKASRAIAAAALRGETISSVLPQFPAAFPPFVHSMVEAGERSGKMEQAMRRLAEYFESASALEVRFSAATLYPKIVLVGLILVYLLVSNVQIINTPRGFHGLLVTIVSQLLSLIVLFVIIWYGVRLLFRIRLVQIAFDALKMMIPGLGTMVRKMATTKWCSAMAMLYGAGFALHSAILVAGDACGNASMAARIHAEADRVMQGEPVSAVMLASGVFPHLAIDMMIVGEKSGSVEESLKKVAEYMAQETEAAGNKSAVFVGLIFYLIIMGLVMAFAIQFYVGYFTNLLDLGDTLAQ